MKPAAIIEESQQQRADDALAGLVPSEATDHAVSGPRMFDLDHRGHAGLVGSTPRLRDDAAGPGALKSREPLQRFRVIARGRREVNGRLHLRQETFERLASRR